MAGTTKREKIIDNIVTTLTGITVANGYRTTVTQVTRGHDSLQDVIDGNTACPSLGVAISGHRFEMESTHRLKEYLDIDITGYVTASDEATRTERLANLIADIRDALLVDIHRGVGDATYPAGPAVETRFDGRGPTLTDEYDPGAYHREVITGSLVFPVVCYYFTDWTP